MSKRVFKHVVRVPYADIDKMGFVYYANYLVYFEMARAQLLRDAGFPYTRMEEDGVMLPVISANCEYKKPARYDDELTVLSRCVGIKGTKLRIEYEVFRTEDGSGARMPGDGLLICTGYTEHVCVSMETGKVMKPVEEIKALMEVSDD